MSPKCFHVEPEVFPSRARIPSVETCHVKEHTLFSMQPEEPLELGHKTDRNPLLPASL